MILRLLEGKSEALMLGGTGLSLVLTSEGTDLKRGHDTSDDFLIFHAGSTPPVAVPAANTFLHEAAAAGLMASACIHPGGDDDRRRLSKRRHDLKAALRTLNFTFKALSSGYTFQDEAAAAKIEAIGRAVAILDKEGEVLAKLFTTE